MSYNLVFSARAEAFLAKLPSHILNGVETNLLRLAASPTSLSRPGAFPYPENTQVYTFGFFDIGDVDEWRFSVHFRFSQDEAELYILAIGGGQLRTL